jgi:hypothetical protein
MLGGKLAGPTVVEEIAMTKSKGFKEDRDNKTGKFVTEKYADRHPDTTTREVVPKPGHGDTGRYDKNK